MDDDADDENRYGIVSDEELNVPHATLNEALVTRIGGRGRGETNEDSDIHASKPGSHLEISSIGVNVLARNPEALLPNL